MLFMALSLLLLHAMAGVASAVPSYHHQGQPPQTVM
eukprot:COSAG01_NODE_52354_length_347_cov_0.766129_2_plen_35_part_01